MRLKAAQAMICLAEKAANTLVPTLANAKSMSDAAAQDLGGQTCPDSHWALVWWTGAGASATSG